MHRYGFLVSKTLNELHVLNAEIEYVNITYANFIITGIVLMIISAALKKAVAVEDRQTI